MDWTSLEEIHPKIKNKKIVSEIIDEEYRYQWIGRH